MLNNGRVLIVEDDKEMICLLTTLLQEEGFEISHGLGEEALKLAEQIQPDLIILDIMMPEMNGLEWSNKAKTNPKINKIPIVVLSAAGSLLLKENYGSLKATSYVPKPFDIEQLLNLIYAFRSVQTVQAKSAMPEFASN